MGDLRECPKCQSIFNYNGMFDICNSCMQKEEECYQVVYRFLRRRENRSANAERIEEATGVDKELLYKWLKKGRLQAAKFPNLGYPCNKCGNFTKKGKLCNDCVREIESGLRTFNAAKEFRESIKKRDKGTYLSEKDKK